MAKNDEKSLLKTVEVGKWVELLKIKREETYQAAKERISCKSVGTSDIL